MAEYFKRKIIGNLSDKPIILKKINPIPTTSIVNPIIPVEEPIVSEEIIETPIEETVTPIEEPITSEEITEKPIEEPKPKKSRKKKSE